MSKYFINLDDNWSFNVLGTAGDGANRPLHNVCRYYIERESKFKYVCPNCNVELPNDLKEKYNIFTPITGTKLPIPNL